MNCNINKVITLTAGILMVVGNSVSALPTIGKSSKRSALKTAAACDPATAVIDLDINNVRARMMTGGDMWWNQGTSTAAYEVPKGSRKNALYAGSCWVGGLQDGSLKVAAQTYRSDGNDYWPGPLNSNNQTFEITRASCNEWDRFWKLDRVVVNEYKRLGDYAAAAESERYRAIFEWPARGNGLAAPGSTGESNNNSHKALGSTGAVLELDDREYAPFVDLDGNKIYNPETGDYPNMEDPGRGDQMIWWVFNDRGNAKLQTKSESIGLEVQTSAFAFATKDFLNDATFINYRVINRAGLTLDSAYMATWTDADLGYAFDDYIGCDTSRGLGILYNATPIDGNGEPTSYGANPPMVGVDFFIGPQRYFKDPLTGLEDTIFLEMQAFTYFNNVGAGVPPEILDPSNGIEFYNYMTGSKRFGGLFSNDVDNQCTGLGQGDPVKFVFAGEVNSGWSECACENPPGDRRFIHSAGPFQLRPGDVNDIVIGAVWVANAGGCPNASFGKIKIADDLTQELFDNKFKTIEGPWAPRVVYREMDRKLVFYLQNDDPTSTNYREKYGYDDSAKYRIVSRKAAKLEIADSVYKFEGYRVFQLRGSDITATQIFDEDGKLDETVAKEVFQCDIKNGVKTIRNWSKDVGAEDCANCFVGVTKVKGKDSGISHSFQLTADAFATGDDKRLVNYKSYYYVAIAYAFNNFASFNQFAPDSTQDKAYLESQKDYQGKPLEVIVAMPNPANKDMGTSLNSDYGTGVVIKQLEGKGNGGNDVQLNSVSEEEALLAANNYQVAQPLYDSGHGPIDVKVVDPLKVQGGNWTVYLVKDPTKPGDISYPDLEKGMLPGNVRWQIVKDGDIANPLYAERNLDVLNEQILENYGLSINIKQALRPGENQDSIEKNGYITSDVTFADIRTPWLAGVNDEEKQSQLNWIRSGGSKEDPAANLPCNYDDNQKLDSFQYYEKMLANNAQTLGSWAPYDLASVENKAGCGFGVAKQNTVGSTPSAMFDLQSVDVVFTADKSKWSKCVVVEMNDALLSEGAAKKFYLRNHNSWTGDVDANGNPVYGSDMGFSYFPGYAVNQETGERLNIVFGEDSYLKGDNGRDMIWNPSSTIIDLNGTSIFGGRHYIYISKTKYDACDSISKLLTSNNEIQVNKVYNAMMWVGLPITNILFPLTPLKDGLIPTTTRLRFRVKRPYAYYAPPGVTLDNTFNAPGYPKYQFTTNDLVPYKLSDASNPYSDDKKKLLDRMHVVPNPYYAYTGYEKNRLDTRVKIINLPRKATIHIYSLDGSLIKKLTKDDDLAYIDWDTRNTKGLPIASGMYIVHVKADGIGERVIKWFGAMRPVDITNY